MNHLSLLNTQTHLSTREQDFRFLSVISLIVKECGLYVGLKLNTNSGPNSGVQSAIRHNTNRLKQQNWHKRQRYSAWLDRQCEMSDWESTYRLFSTIFPSLRSLCTMFFCRQEKKKYGHIVLNESLTKQELVSGSGTRSLEVSNQKKLHLTNNNKELFYIDERLKKMSWFCCTFVLFSSVIRPTLWRASTTRTTS